MVSVSSVAGFLSGAQRIGGAPASALVFIDPQFRFQRVEGPLLDRLGLSPEELVGKPVAEVFPELVSELGAGAYYQALSGESATNVAQYAGRTISSRMLPLQGEEGEVQGVFIYCEDITAEQQNESQLQDTLAELAKRDQSQKAQVQALSRALTEAERNERQRIAQVLHDDIQQMLMAAQIRLDMLEGSVAADAGSQFAELQGLLETITDATRSLSVELRAEILHSEQLSKILAWTAAMMAEQYRLQVEVDTQGPCTVSSRSTRELIYKSVRELLFNVVKHGGVEKARVWARTVGDNVVLAVADEGAGFDVDAALASASAGESFGLSSVRERITLFGGHCDIDSAPGQGTRVTIVLPRFSD